MNSSTPSGRNNALFYAPKKSPKWGELLQFRVDAVVNGKCVSEGELVLTKTPVQLGASSR